MSSTSLGKPLWLLSDEQGSRLLYLVRNTCRSRSAGGANQQSCATLHVRAPSPYLRVQGCKDPKLVASWQHTKDSKAKAECSCT